MLGSTVGACGSGAHDAHARRCTTRCDRARLDLAIVGTCNLTIGYELRPVRGEQPVQRNVQAACEQDVRVDARVRRAILNAADLDGVNAGGFGESFLAEISPVADAADVAADRHALRCGVRVDLRDWIFSHTAKLEVRALRVPNGSVKVLDHAGILIDASATDSVEHVIDLAASGSLG